MNTQFKPIVHTFTESGLGESPFKLVSYYKSPVMSGCAHCGTGIKHVFIIKSADGKNSKVGSECVKKTGDYGLIDTVKRLQRQERARLRREEQQLIADRKLEDQRRVNGGLTDYELSQKKRSDEKDSYNAQLSLILPMVTDLADFLMDHKAGFRDSVAMNLYIGDTMSDNMLNITYEILAKRCGRKGSESYFTEYNRVRSVITEFYSKVESNRSIHPNWRLFR